jgi:hypothetical protein
MTCAVGQRRCAPAATSKPLSNELRWISVITTPGGPIASGKPRASCGSAVATTSNPASLSTSSMAARTRSSSSTSRILRREGSVCSLAIGGAWCGLRPMCNRTIHVSRRFHYTISATQIWHLPRSMKFWKKCLCSLSGRWAGEIRVQRAASAEEPLSTHAHNANFGICQRLMGSQLRQHSITRQGWRWRSVMWARVRNRYYACVLVPIGPRSLSPPKRCKGAHHARLSLRYVE